jgi:signal peptidase I
VVLSLIVPGLGHIYCGKMTRGLVFAFLTGMSVMIALLLLVYCAPMRLLTFSTLIFLALLAVPLIATVDAYRIARRIKSDYELKEYNRWYVYIIMALIISSNTVGYSLYVREQFLEPFFIPTCHNYPTITPGDRILASKRVYKTIDPARGDIIVFRNPQNMRQNQIKRIVAVAGDTVEIHNDALLINGLPLKRDKVPHQRPDKTDARLQGEVFYESNGEARYKIILSPREEELQVSVTDFARITVPANHCFVLGDNRHYSRDSRHYGPVPLVGIRGRADYLYWPADGWSRFGRIDR